MTAHAYARSRRRTLVWVFVAALTLIAVQLADVPAASANHLTGLSATYTLDADFDDGTLVNVNHDDVADQLQLDSVATPFDFIWVAASARGTVVKIDTNTGTILGEYRTSPATQAIGNPSRTTVDNDGSVWVANRNNVSNGFGTIVHVGLEENGQCEDRNTNGVIDTSTGLGDIKPWANATGTRGVATADDECIVHYTQVNSQGTRHISVDANNDVWVSGFSLRNFDLVKGGKYDVPLSGTIMRSEAAVGFGGYGGLIDPNGVIWSARPLLRWDTVNPLTGPNGDPPGPSVGPPAPLTNWSGQGFPDSYGLCIDSFGNVWNTQLFGNIINKYAPDGTHLGAFAHGNSFAQGCVVDGNDDVWVAHSLIGPQTTVGHLLNNGTYVGNVPLPGGAGPTGVAVDGAGQIWAANINSDNVSRIDPTAGPIGGGGVPIGAVNLTVPLGAGAGPYNYSDMTGSTLIAPPDSGTWTIVHDCGVVDANWGTVSWTSAEPGDSSISVTAASGAAAGGPFSAVESVTDGVDLSVPDGQFLEVVVSFQRATTSETPVLFDLTIDCERQATINVIKLVDSQPDGAFDDDPSDWRFDVRDPAGNTDTATTGPSGLVSFEVEPGRWTRLTERSGPEGQWHIEFECRDADGRLLRRGSTINPPRTVFLNLDPRQEVTCTFWNQLMAGYLTGGGQIVDDNDGRLKPAKRERISFAGPVGIELDGDLHGQYQINFHNVSRDWLDKAKFHSTSIDRVWLNDDATLEGAPPPDSIYNTILFWATGRLNGEDGWKVRVWATDTGEPGSGPNAGDDYDSWHVLLYKPGVAYYNSLWDFPAEQSWRHNLDHGNLQLHVAEN